MTFYFKCIIDILIVRVEILGLLSSDIGLILKKIRISIKIGYWNIRNRPTSIY